MHPARPLGVAGGLRGLRAESPDAGRAEGGHPGTAAGLIRPQPRGLRSQPL